ncbi:MAG: hypothetical protein AAFV80_21515 [Bacteroidota bacterium]
MDRLIAVIEEKLAHQQSIDSELAQIHTLANKENTFYEATFQNYWSSISKAELIEAILRPHPPNIDNLTQEEILKILHKMTHTDIDHSTYYLNLLDQNLSYPYGISDLIYWPNQLGYPLDLSLEEMASILFEHKPPPTQNQA